MAGNNVRIGALRYDIIADSSLFTQGVKKASRMSRKLAKDIAVTRTPLERFKKELLQARRALKANLIDEKAYLHTKKRLRAQYIEENALINKHTHRLLLNTKAKNANAIASSRMNLANIGGAAASMFGGRGGAAVGRGIGIGAMAGGPAGIGLAAAFGGAYATARMMEEFGDLQEAATDLKVFLGEEFGEESANAFRKIARESSLTTKGLIKNARVWASYGLETENIVDMVERLGIAAGGEREAFDNLTRAMAQVNAAGKLMGQEKNQLINAGFSLKIIADEAGVSMTNFAKAMEEGAISAKHVNDALIKATSEGGLYFGRLEKKSQTLNGQLDLVANNFNDLFANLGESKSGFFSTILSQLNETLSDVSSVISKANELEKLRREVEQLRARAAGKESTSQQKKESYKSWLARGMETYGQVKSDFTLFPNDAKYEKARAEFPGITKAADHFLGMTVATAALFDELTTSAEDAEAKRKAEIQSLQKEKSILKQRVGDDPTKGTGGDPNVLTGTTAENLAEAAKQAAGLPGNLGPGTIDEYNFIRDKMMEDRNLALKSLQEQKEQTKQLRILNGGEAGGRPKPNYWNPRFSRRNSIKQGSARIRAGLAPRSMMPGGDSIGWSPLDPYGTPASNLPMWGGWGQMTSAADQVRAEHRAKQRAIYDKWKMTDAVHTSEGSYGTTLSESERRGLEEESGELRRLFKRDLAKAKEQDETTKDWVEFMATSFNETIKEQTRQLTGGEDKQLEGVD